MSFRNLLIGGLLIAALGAITTARRGGTSAIDVDTAVVARAPVLRAFVTASGDIVATRYADIGSSAMGRIVSLPVREGDRVKAGQVLARIDPVQAASSAEAAQAALAALQAEALGAADQVRAAQADLDAAKARATEAQKALARARELRQAGLSAIAELDAAQAAADTAQAQVGAAGASLRRAEQSRDAAARRVAQGNADTTRARDQLAKTEITAPIDGTITRLDVEEGEMVVIGVQNQPGTILMTVSDMSSVNAEVKVAEADVLRLRVGNTATVTLEALPGQRFPGRVVEIGASALPQVGTQAAAREFRVRVRLEGDVVSLRPGLTCDAEVLVGERTQVLTVPLQAIVERPGVGEAAQTGVFLVENDTVRFAAVETGIIGGLSIEVTGVPEGARIVAGPFQALRQLENGAAIRARASTTQ
jgi:HlyD family secretion protein